MKQVLLVIAIAAVVAVVVVKVNGTSEMKKVDAKELAQFQAWKEATDNSVDVKPVAVKHSTGRSVSSPKRSVNYQSPKMVSESQNQAKTKKGWSKAAKGTAIGAGTGAVLGAVINKRNRTVGAVVGGILGAGAGYGIGRGMDKKDGRY